MAVEFVYNGLLFRVLVGDGTTYLQVQNKIKRADLPSFAASVVCAQRTQKSWVGIVVVEYVRKISRYVYSYIDPNGGLTRTVV